MSTETPEIDLSQITGEQLAQMVTNTTDEQLREAINVVGAEAALDRIFGEMPDRYRGGAEASVQFVIEDSGERHPYDVELEGETCRVTRGEIDDPRVTLTTNLPTFLRLITGDLDGPAAFMAGKLKIAGDLMFASRLLSFFEAPTA